MFITCICIECVGLVYICQNNTPPDVTTKKSAHLNFNGAFLNFCHEESGLFLSATITYRCGVRENNSLNEIHKTKQKQSANVILTLANSARKTPLDGQRSDLTQQPIK